MKSNIIKEKSFKFSLKLIQLYKDSTSRELPNYLTKQMIRSGTSIGALVRESEHAKSRADFIHKFSIALKEANETEYWIDLLHQTKYISTERFKPLKADIIELLKILTAIVKTSKNQPNQP